MVLACCVLALAGLARIACDAGPAANSGLVEDDLVTMIDGVDVQGADMRMVDELLRLPVGATVQLGLARGVTVTITAEDSRR